MTPNLTGFISSLLRQISMSRVPLRLYCEEIDVGEGAPRQIASGLVPHYSLEAMKDRRVVVMCNLKVDPRFHYFADLSLPYSRQLSGHALVAGLLESSLICKMKYW